jgi:hypothetical protein
MLGPNAHPRAKTARDERLLCARDRLFTGPGLSLGEFPEDCPQRVGLLVGEEVSGVGDDAALYVLDASAAQAVEVGVDGDRAYAAADVEQWRGHGLGGGARGVVFRVLGECLVEIEAGTQRGVAGVCGGVGGARLRGDP